MSLGPCWAMLTCVEPCGAMLGGFEARPGLLGQEWPVLLGLDFKA